MTAATMQQTPAVPPRPSKSADKDSSTASIPKIPPRPISKRLERSVSPNADRFAPSPLNEGIANKKSTRLTPSYAGNEQAQDPIERSGSVPMPSVGEEGWEYSAYTDDAKQQEENDDKAKSRAASPEQTRTVDADLQLHAPKPSLPALSAKQRVMTVTRTDSEKAASFGIGRPAGQPKERAASRDGIKKKPSTSFSTASDTDLQTDDEQGIPEIGQRVPMNPHLGDVQAPSPGPGSEAAKRHHGRKHSARGLPPGSYGLHGHGVTPQDKLERAYYQKHPELKDKEHTPLHDRQNDFAMSKDDLNKLVRDTASRGTSASELRGIPTDEVGFQASHEYASRMSRPTSTVPRGESHASTPVKQSFQADLSGPDGDGAIHVDDPKHPEYRSYGDEDATIDEEEHEYNAPILAEDEVGKDPNAYLQRPAVHPPPERRGSAFEMEDAPSSRPGSRPTSIYNNHSQTEFGTTPLEDVEEYEPLFPDETNKEKEKRELAEANKARHHFPSKDIWEDAPNSVHYTTEVTTPDVVEGHKRKPSQSYEDRSITPAQAFAQHQEELADREAQAKKAGQRSDNFMPLLGTPDEKEKPTWIGQQSHLKADRSGSSNRFPSRDVWEDAPESQLYQATLSSSPEDSKPQVPSRPTRGSGSTERPSVPSRPKPKQIGSDDGAKARPAVSDKPKPQVPARPSKSSSADSKDGELSRPKPPVPSRPAGGKIAALQAGFMSDLNKRLQLGPQAPKKEETQEQELNAEKEKAPLSDARKSRARGPQRRAPAKSPAPAATAAPTETAKSIPTFTFTAPQTYWVIDPEDGSVAVDHAAKEQAFASVAAEGKADQIPVAEEVTETEIPEESTEPEKTESAEDAPTTEVPQETAKSEKTVEAAEPDQSTESVEPEEPPKMEEKTLVANTAGESILETTVEKKDEGDEVEPVTVDDVVKS